jgi:hypothetical protein
MNIFFLHVDPKVAAEAHCDKHVVKMLLESTQLLWTAWHILNEGATPPDDAPTTKAGARGYRLTHKNHPCAIWARARRANYLWLCALAAALADEYHYRYPAAAGPHACEAHVAWLTANPPRSLLLGAMTAPPLAMPAEFKISRDPVKSYRAFYVGSKGARGLLTYTRRPQPEWITGVV